MKIVPLGCCNLSEASVTVVLEDRIITRDISLYFQWSFGVVLWELMTRGKTPYADVDNFFLKQYLERGRRLDIPQITPGPV